MGKQKDTKFIALIDNTGGAHYYYKPSGKDNVFHVYPYLKSDLSIAMTIVPCITTLDIIWNIWLGKEVQGRHTSLKIKEVKSLKIDVTPLIEEAYENWIQDEKLIKREHRES